MIRLFGWVLIKESDYEFKMDVSNLAVEKWVAANIELGEARKENKRLFDLHNKRLTKPRRDKNGKLRNPDGTFAKGV